MAYLDSFIRKTKEIDIGGKNFTFSELSLSDFAQFRGHIVEQREKTKDERRLRLLDQAKKIGGIDPLKLLEQLEKPLSDDELEEEMYTMDGIGFLAYLSLKYAYPEIRLDEVMQMISVNKIEEIALVITGGIKDTKKKPEKRAKPKVR